MLMYKQKKNHQAGRGGAGGGNRLLISITVIGSAGPIRFVVNEEELVGSVMDTALKSYAREGRLPILGSNIHDFVLYCPIAGTEALAPLETIGSFGVRNFMLCKKPQAVEEVGDGNFKEELRQLEIVNGELLDSDKVDDGDDEFEVVLLEVVHGHLIICSKSNPQALELPKPKKNQDSERWFLGLR